MTQKELIRQEIERLKGVSMVQIKANPGQTFPFIMEMTGYDKILAFIDSLPEETCKDSLQVHETCKENTDSFTSLDEAADEYASDSNGFIDMTAYNAFIAGAKWMRKKDVEDMYMSDNRHFLKCYEQGKVDMKVELMKEVKSGVVCKNGERDEEDVWIELNPGSLPDYKDIDPIDFIIVKNYDRPRD